MRIVINDLERTVDDGITVAELLVGDGLGGKPCAVEVNRRLVPKRLHAECVLRDGDRVELVTLVGGG